MKYTFNNDGFLEIQQIKKCEMAYFYNCTPNNFRKELEKAGIFIFGFKKRFYSNIEVQRIFNHFGPISRADVENAQKKISDYYAFVKARDLQKYGITTG